MKEQSRQDVLHTLEKRWKWLRLRVTQAREENRTLTYDCREMTALRYAMNAIRCVPSWPPPEIEAVTE